MTDVLVNSGPIVEVVGRSTPAMEAVLALHRRHQQTLGFLPKGAFQQWADEGRLHVARLDGRFAGYVGYRVSRGEAVIAHLCVGEEHRRHGVAGALLGRVFRESSHLLGVRLSCRRDYEAANLMWPRFGFTCATERPGRGRDGMVLLEWRRANRDAFPLFAPVHEEQRLAARNVVVDANVFFDFEAADDDEAAVESKSLLAGWLEHEILLCVTGELANEIARHADEAVRARHRRQMNDYFQHSSWPEAIERALVSVEDLLPPCSSRSDESDRRQLAHAVAARAEFFVTRDSRLLNHAATLTDALGIRVLRPADLVRVIHGDLEPEAYAPARLVGTRFIERTVTCEGDLRPFQAFAESEPGVSYLRLCRRLLTDPGVFTTRTVATPDGRPILAYSIERDASSAEDRIVLLRALRQPVSATLLRRVLSEVVIGVQRQGNRSIRCEDLVDPLVRAVLPELGFREAGSSQVKTSLHGLRTRSSLIALHPELAAIGTGDHAIERQFWPVKVSDTDLRSYVLPIQPQWASHLFDAQLAEGELFGAERDQALALENVYYSASPVQLPTGARILWYVSGDVQQVRACSICLESVRLPAREAFRRYERLGIYERHHVLDLTEGDPKAPVTAHRFAFTERLASPVSWRRLQDVLTALQGNGNPIAGPASISAQAFNALYSEATGAPQG